MHSFISLRRSMLLCILIPLSFLTTKSFGQCDQCPANQPPVLEIDDSDTDIPTVFISCAETTPVLPDPLPITDVSDDCTTVDASDVIITDDHPGVLQTGCEYLTTRTYSITDECGEETIITETWSYTTKDNFPSLLSVPFGTTISCIDDAPPAQDLTWVDNCDGTGQVSPTEIVGTMDPCTGGAITRTWTYTNSCNNIVIHVQTINVVPEIALSLSDMPADISVGCGDPLPPLEDLTYTNGESTASCEIAGSITPIESGTLNACGDQITRTWDFTSACGVVLNHVQTITLEDDDAPVFDNIPVDITIGCISDLPPVEDVMWTDACDGTGLANVTPLDLTSGCAGGIFQRTYDYTDSCGNPVSHTQNIFVSAYPNLNFSTTLPTDITISCGDAVPSAVDLDYTNGLDGTPCEVSGTVAAIDSGTLNVCGDQITRTWTIAEDAANCVAETIITITITLEDDGMPSFNSTPPATVTVSCSADIPAAQDLEWMDDCDGTGMVGFVEAGSPDPCTGGIITRTWEYIDMCGNGPITFIQEYIVEEPMFTSCDDGDSCTENDIVKLDCDGNICVPCMGTPTDCDGDVNFVSCNDNNPCTENDMEGIACDNSVCVPCMGTPVATCSGILPNEVLPCDDGDPCTINDVYEVDGCDLVTECVPCAGTPNPTPDPTPPTGNIGCVDESTTLTLTGCGEIVTWYDAPGGSVLHIGDTFTTPTLTADVSYYVTCSINGCESDAIEVPVTVVTPTPISISGDSEICLSQETITLTADAGYDTYDWGAGAGPDATFDVSTGGIYSVTATDSNGCTVEASTTIDEAPIPDISIAGSLSFCIGNSTTLEVPTGFDSYLWAPNGETGNTVDADAAGTYSVTVTNSNGCTDEASIDIIEANGLMPSISGDLSFCEGESTDLILDSSYDVINWAPNGETTETITVDAAGTYSVTVSDADGCTGIATVDVTEDPNPTPTITGDILICTDGTLTLSADAGYDNYEWNDGSSSQDLDITSPGTYTVTVTDANGCTGTTDIIIDAAPEPMVDITGDLSLCPGGSDMVTLSATGGFDSYSWSDGSSSGNTIDVSMAGTYTVTVTDSNGCTGTASADIIEDTPPMVTIDGNLQFCSDNSTTLTATTGLAGYVWSTGDSSESIDADMPGDYTVTVTDMNGCTNEETVTVSELTELMPQIEGDLDLCPGGVEDVTLSVMGTFVTYDWGTGAGPDGTLTVDTPGDYSVTVTDINGCTGNSTVTIIENMVDMVTISGGPNFCTGTTLDLTAAGVFDSYSWSNGDAGATATVDMAGIYSVTATDVNGCTNTAELEVVEIPDPIVDISGDLTLCPGGSDMVMLTATAGYDNYQWSNGSNGSNEITVGAAGSYTVTVTDINGCTNTAMVEITEDTPPDVTIDGNMTFCIGFNTTLTATAGLADYAWSDGSTTNTIDVSTSGTFTVTATDDNGCTNTASIDVEQLTELMPTIVGDTDICPGGNEDIDLTLAGTYTAYEWGDGTTGNSITVNAAGSYSVTVTDENGCSGNATIDIIENIVDMLTISGGPNFCTGTTLDLTAEGNFDSYNWSNGGENAVNGITLPGIYSVTATDVNGCTNTAEIEVFEIPDPTVDITGDMTLCPGDTDMVTLTATDGLANYEWSNGTNGTNEITVGAAGTYTVTVSDINGCTNTAMVEVTEDEAPPVDITGNEIFCLGFTTTLTATSGYADYIWSSGETTESIEGDASGTYSVTVSDANGCTNEASIDVVQLTELMPMISGENDICPGGNEDIQLTADEGYDTYDWGSGPGPDNSLIVSAAGEYSVTVTDSNGCTGNSSITITENIVDVVMITGGPNFCTGTTLNLIAEGNFDTYSWSNGNSLASIGVNEAGIYTVTATDINGCSSTADIEVFEIPDPMVEITGDDMLCPGGSDMVDLTATAGLDNYSWSNGESGSNVISVGAAGEYTVTVTDINGCTNTATFAVMEDTPPDVTIDGSLVFCTGFSSTLSATGGMTAYEWSSGELTQDIEVTTSGTYTVTVTDNDGCTNTAQIEVTELSELMPEIVGELDICPGAQEDVTLSIDGTFVSYEWGSDASGTETTFTTNQAGTYSVTVTDENGCSGNSTVTIIENIVDDVEITGPESFCSGLSAGLTATAGWSAYSWSNGASGFFTDVDMPGTYSVTVTDDNGCTNSAEFTVTENENPTPMINGDFDLCEGETETIDVGMWADIIWSTGDTGSTIDVSSAGDYIATVTDDNGCTNSAMITVVVNPLPEPMVSGDLSFCAAGSTTLTLDGTYAGVIWSTGETTNDIIASTFEEFTVTVTDDNGCENSTSVITELQDGLFPEITGPDLVCVGSTIELDAGEYLLYAWDDGSTTNPLEVTTEGTYTVTVTDAGDCTGIATYTVTEAEPTAVDIEGNPFFCAGESVEISASGDHVAYEWSTGDLSASIDLSEIGTYIVTATDANGCMSTNEIEIIEQPNPEPIIEGALMYCLDSETVIGTSETFEEYEWSTGETTQEISVGVAGTYSVTVTNENGCIGEHQVDISQFEEFVPRISGLLTFCIDGFTEIYADPGYASYEWSTGETTDLIQVDQEGTYTVTVTDENGCTAIDMAEVVEQDQLYPEITSTGLFCEGGDGILNAGTGYVAFEWDDPNNSDTQTIVVQDGGIYSVTVTDAFGCTGTDVFEIIEAPSPEVEITGVIELCEGESTELFATPGFDSYEWSPAGDGESIEVDEEGTYTVTIQDENGCIATTSIFVEVHESPEPELWGLDIVCDGFTNTFQVAQDYDEYLWSTGETTQSIEHGGTDIVTVIVTDENGCTGEGEISQSVYPINEVEIAGSTNYCSGGSTTLDAGLWISYEWEGPVFGFDQFLEASITGEYTVYVTDYNGCTSSSSVFVEEGTELFPNVTGNFEFCTGGSAILNAGVFDSYEWTGPEEGDEQIFEVTTPGEYTLVVSQGSCVGEFEFEVEEFVTPIATIEGGTSICNGQATVLSTQPSASIAWSNGASSESITVDQAGIYSVTITDNNGCTGVSSVEVELASDPNIQISGDGFFCPGSTTILTTGVFDSYAWSNGQTTQSIEVGTSGTISVTVTDGGGCTGVGTLNVVEIVEDPLIIGGSTTFCAGSSTTLDAGAGYTAYSWSNGETTQSILVEDAGAYTVTVTTAGGCQLSTSITTSLETSLTFSILGDANVCSGETTTLDAGNFDSYVWSTPEGPFNTQTIEVSTPGIYSVMVDDGNGCTGESMITLTEIDITEPTITGVSTICEGAETIISVDDIYNTYNWSNGSTTATTTVSNPGTYSLTVTNTQGCDAITSVEVTQDDAPTPIVLGPSTFCPGSTVTLDAGDFESYHWSGGATGQTIDIGVAGDIFVTVTDANGCTGVASTTLTSNETEEPQLTGSTTFCVSSSTTLEVLGSWDNIIWSTGDNTSSVEIDVAGDYNVTVTDALGCTSQTTVSITEEDNLSVNVIADSDIICSNSTSNLSAGNFFDSYEWSTGETTSTIAVMEEGTYTVTVSDASGCTGIGSVDVNDGTFVLDNLSGNIPLCEDAEIQLGFTTAYSSQVWSTGEETQFITVTDPGNYSITVTNALGCEAVSSFSVVAEDIEPVEILGGSQICDDATLSLTAEGYASYIWSVPGQFGETIEVTEPGTYSVTVTNAAGCETTGEINVTNYPDNELTIAGSTTFCTGSSTILSLGNDWTNVMWSNGETGNTVTISDAGPISVTALDINGCETFAEATISVDSELMPIIIGEENVCQGETILLDAGEGFGFYEWNTGENTQTIEVDAAGTYTVDVVDLSGQCSGTGSFDVAMASIVEPVISGPTTACPTENIILSTEDTYASYEWSTGSTEPTITVTGGGMYSVEVTNDQGCSSVTELLIENEEIPSFAISSLDCSDDGDEYAVVITTDALTVSNDLGLNNEEIAPGQFLISGIADMQIINITISNGLTSCDEIIQVMPPNCECQAIVDAGEDQALDCVTTEVTIGGTDTSSGTQYSYEWTDPNGIVISTEPMATATIGGIYTLEVTDTDMNCSVTDNVFVDPGTLPQPSIIGDNTICQGESTSLILDDNYASYSWSTGSTSSSIDVDEEGTYSVTITDAGGCEGVATFDVSLIEAPSITVLDRFCNEDEDMYTVIFETDADDYEIDLPNNVEDLGDGTYSISGIDISTPLNITASNSSLNCETTLEVSPPNCNCPAIADAGVDQTLDCLGSTITLGGDGTTEGGTFTYEWIDPTGMIVSTELTAQATIDGAYTLIVTDTDLDCTDSDVVMVETPTLPETFINGDAMICEGSTATLSLDQTWESYNWSTGETSATIETDATGDYTVTVTNAAGCEGTAIYFVEVIATPSIQLMDRFCNEDADEYTVLFSTDAESFEIDLSLNIEDLGSGTYSVSGIDINTPLNISASNSSLNCNESMTIMAPNCFCEVEADAGAPQMLTCEITTVTLGGDLTTTGNNVALTWTDEDGNIISDDQYVDVAEPGIYTLEVYDITEDCSIINTVEVTEETGEPIAIILSDTDNVIDCQLVAVELYVNPEANTEYVWSIQDSEMNGTNVMVEVDGEVVLTAINTITGCTSLDTIIITDMSEFPIIELQEPLELNCNNEEVLIGTSADNFGADILIEWFDANNQILNSGNDSILVTEPGLYFIQATDPVSGCFNMDSIEVFQFLFEPAIEAGDDIELPCNENTTEIEALNVSVDTDRDFEYTWSTTDGNIVQGQNALTPVVNLDGTYYVEIMDVLSGCVAMDSIHVLSNENKPYGIESIVQDPFCANDENGFIQVAGVQGGEGPFTYMLNGESANQDGIFDNLGVGTYELLIEDTNGCVHDTIVEIGFENEVILEADPPLLVLIEENSGDVELITNLTGSEISSIEWNDAEGVSCTDCLNPTITSETNKDYVITIFDEFGCADTTTVRVVVELEDLVYAPNIITPGNDDDPNIANKRFTIYANPQVERIEELHIYDRWGELMFVNFDFQPNRPSLGWTGEFRGENVVPGVYVFIATYRTTWGETGILKGDVTVAR